MDVIGEGVVLKRLFRQFLQDCFKAVIHVHFHATLDLEWISVVD